MQQTAEKPVKALIIDDDPLFCRILSTGLCAADYDVSVISCFPTAEAFIESKARGVSGHGPGPLPNFPDVIILDYFLDNGKTGLELCKAIRRHSAVPIVMLTGNTSTEAAIACLESGADQYIHKPCQVPELLARINASRRRATQAGPAGWSRTEPAPERRIERAEATLLPDERTITLGEMRIALTEKECRLAEILFLNMSTPVSKDDIGSHVYGSARNLYSRSIDVLVGRLRTRLRSADSKFRIISERNFGYRLVRKSS